MQILPINKNNQTNFQAVNQKYLQMAKKEAKGRQRFGEILTVLRYDVDWGNIHPQDGIDTVEAFIKQFGIGGDFVEHLLEGFRAMLKK